MMDNEAIKQFTRDVLGCTCPDDVFNTITCEDDVEVATGLKLTHKIGIGGRLLIYITRMSDRDSCGTKLAALVHHGRHERDAGGFNRLRLVCVCKDVGGIRDAASMSFACTEKDEKIHLHVLGESEFPL